MLNNEPPADVQVAITNMISMVVRGVTLKKPKALAVHGHRDALFIRAELQPEGAEAHGEVVGLMLQPCTNFVITPATGVHFADFQGEWPPVSLIKEMSNQIVVPEQTPKLFVPGNGRGRR